MVVLGMVVLGMVVLGTVGACTNATYNGMQFFWLTDLRFGVYVPVPVSILIVASTL
jgi:hypothetical protein